MIPLSSAGSVRTLSFAPLVWPIDEAHPTTSSEPKSNWTPNSKLPHLLLSTSTITSKLLNRRLLTGGEEKKKFYDGVSGFGCATSSSIHITQFWATSLSNQQKQNGALRRRKKNKKSKCAKFACPLGQSAQRTEIRTHHN
jgi:hypothetical protein